MHSDVATIQRYESEETILQGGQGRNHNSSINQEHNSSYAVDLSLNLWFSKLHKPFYGESTFSPTDIIRISIRKFSLCFLKAPIKISSRLAKVCLALGSVPTLRTACYGFIRQSCQINCVGFFFPFTLSLVFLHSYVASFCRSEIEMHSILVYGTTLGS